jgi:hypothetical protein
MPRVASASVGSDSTLPFLNTAFIRDALFQMLEWHKAGKAQVHHYRRCSFCSRETVLIALQRQRDKSE